MQGITRHSCQEEVTEMEDKLINRPLVGEEFPSMDTELLFLHSAAIHQYFNQRDGTRCSNLEFFQNYLKP